MEGTFWVGVLGSLAAELSAAVRLSSENHGHWPTLYRAPFYLAVRAIIMFVGAGPLALFMANGNALTAFYIGASAPLIIDQLAKGVRPADA